MLCFDALLNWVGRAFKCTFCEFLSTSSKAWFLEDDTTPMWMPPAWIMVLMLYLRVGLSLYGILKWASQELEAPWRLLPPFQSEHLGWVWASWPALIYLTEKQAARFPHDWWKIFGSAGCSHYVFGRTIGGRVHWKTKVEGHSSEYYSWP